MAHLWAGGYITPAASGIPSASERGENQKWPTCGQGGYVTPTASGMVVDRWRVSSS